MTTIDQPYFMTNADWYTHDQEEMRYRLTDKAPPEAVESYREFYRTLDESYRGDD